MCSRVCIGACVCKSFQCIGIYFQSIVGHIGAYMHIQAHNLDVKFRFRFPIYAHALCVCVCMRGGI